MTDRTVSGSGSWHGQRQQPSSHAGRIRPQRGQALVFGLCLLILASLLLFVQFSVGQAGAAKLRIVNATDAAANPEAHVLNRLTSAVVLKEIDKLPIDFRMVVILADLQEFSYRDIAEMLEVPVGTVMSRLFRGRKLLQKAMTQEEDTGVSTVTDEPVDLAEFRARKKLG